MQQLSARIYRQTTDAQGRTNQVLFCQRGDAVWIKWGKEFYTVWVFVEMLFYFFLGRLCTLLFVMLLQEMLYKSLMKWCNAVSHDSFSFTWKNWFMGFWSLTEFLLSGNSSRRLFGGAAAVCGGSSGLSRRHLCCGWRGSSRGICCQLPATCQQGKLRRTFDSGS